MQSDAATVDEYLAELPEERRAAVSAVRETIRANLKPGFVETMAWGMISYEVPLEVSGPTYNGKPLVYVALASQKNYLAMYLNAAYGDGATAEAFRQGFIDAGKTLDMGKSCVRFKRVDDLALDAVGDVVAAFGPEEWAEHVANAQNRGG